MDDKIINREWKNRYIRAYDPPTLGNAEQWLEPSFWQSESAVVGESNGRNIVWFVTDNEREYVLRHYYRGGLPAKLLKDQFFYTGIEKTRSIAEFNLLMHMAKKGLPVPKPVVAEITRKGVIYTANLLIERIANARDIFQVLCNSALADTEWQQIGKMIAAFHRAGVYHSDLNCHNILWQQVEDKTKPWLIDFDRCYIRQGTTWQEKNIARLKRSLIKEKAKQPAFYWQESDWHAFLQGYAHK